MVGPARFERATLCLEGRCSIQLSYGPVHLFYQRGEKCQRQIITALPQGSSGITSLSELVSLMIGEFTQRNSDQSGTPFLYANPSVDYTFTCRMLGKARLFTI